MAVTVIITDECKRNIEALIEAGSAEDFANAISVPYHDAFWELAVPEEIAADIAQFALDGETVSDTIIRNIRAWLGIKPN